MPTTRETTLSLLANVFGEIQHEQNRIVQVGNINLSELAEELGYDLSQLSRLINPPAGKEPNESSLKRLNRRLQLMDEHQELQKKYRFLETKTRQLESHKKSLIIALLVGIALVLMLANPFNMNSEKSPMLDDKTEKLVADFETYEKVLELKGPLIAQQLAEKGWFICEPYFSSLKNGGSITPEQKVELIKTLQTFVRNGLAESRIRFAEKKYMITQNKRNIIDILNHILPIDQCLNCPPEAFLSDTLPPCSSIYDQKLWEMTPVLFALDHIPSQDEFLEKVYQGVREAQFKIRQEEKKQFTSFQKTGRFQPITEW